MAFRCRFAAILASSLAVLGVGSAHAQSGSSATAEILFQQGKDLLSQGNVSEACPKFAESYRLDAALGTLLGLALCHEQDGKLASAWVEFSDAQGQAKREGRADREQLALEKAEALRPRLSMLTVQVSPEVAATPGLEILRDGEVLGSATWNLAVPVDGGNHVIEARAPGMVPVKLEAAVATESARETVIVPALVAEAPKEAAVAAPPPAAPPAPAKPPPAAESGGFTTLQWVGIGTAGVGVVSLGVGAVFVSSMLDQVDQSESDCDGDVCGDAGFAARTAAREDGDTATLLGVAGAVLLGAGATLYFVGDDDRAPETGARTRLDLTATGHGGALRLTTPF